MEPSAGPLAGGTTVTPAGALGVVDVVVHCPDGPVTLAGGFSFVVIIVPPWASLLEAAPDPAVVTDANLRAQSVGSFAPCSFDSGFRIG